MSMHASTASLEQIGRRLAQARHLLITSHDKPDGDSIGSMLALARLLEAPDRRIDVVYSGPIDPSLLLLAPPTKVQRSQQGLPPDAGEPDCIVVLDTSAWSQLEGMAGYLKSRRERIVVIDHHSHGDDVGAMTLVDPTAAATAMLILELAELMKWKITSGTGGAAEAMYVGLASDTGWFRFQNADARAFAATSRLLALGVNKSRLYEIIEENYRPQRLALMARALASVQFLCDGAIAVMLLTPRDFQETGGAVEDLTNVINLPMSVGAVRASVLITQAESGKTKVSFRSKPPERDGSFFIDVNQLAQTLGGGGHVHAAGARLHLDIEPAKRAVIEALNHTSSR